MATERWRPPPLARCCTCPGPAGGPPSRMLTGKVTIDVWMSVMPLSAGSVDGNTKPLAFCQAHEWPGRASKRAEASVGT